MKKYLAAGAVAIMVFAFSAMAASLTVDGGTLQAGTDTELTCADGAEITYGTPTGASNVFFVNEFTVTFVDENGDPTNACDDQYATLRVNNTASLTCTPNNLAIRQINGDTATFAVDNNCSDTALGFPRVEEITTVSVLVRSIDTAPYSTGIFGEFN